MCLGMGSSSKTAHYIYIQIIQNMKKKFGNLKEFSQAIQIKDSQPVYSFHVTILNCISLLIQIRYPRTKHLKKTLISLTHIHAHSKKVPGKGGKQQ